MKNRVSTETSHFQSVQIALAAGGTRRFFFRKSSQTDQKVIQQIFEAQHYNLAAFPLSGSLKKYANRLTAEGASLLVVDAGANIGASSFYLTQLDPRIHVCAIEPEPENFSVLKVNCEGLPITPIQAAVTCEPGRLWLTDPGIGDWGFRVSGLAGKLQVDAITLDRILEQFNAPQYRPLICKIDIEGGETELFRKNDAWVDRFPLIIIEIHDWLLPGTSTSKTFFAAISKRNFDVVQRGENMFCFNNDLLSKSADP